MNNRIFYFGVGVSLLYTIILVWIGWGRWHELPSLTFNQLGDFLAGAFGPLALFWLVLGFIQQGLGLSQNTEVLSLQQKDLRESAEQHARLVEVGRAQLDIERKARADEKATREREAQPWFTVSGHESKNAEEKYSFVMTNHGASVTDVRFLNQDSIIAFDDAEFVSFRQAERQRIKWRIVGHETPKSSPFLISYVDATERARVQEWRIDYNPGDGSWGVRQVAKPWLGSTTDVS